MLIGQLRDDPQRLLRAARYLKVARLTPPKPLHEADLLDAHTLLSIRRTVDYLVAQGGWVRLGDITIKSANKSTLNHMLRLEFVERRRRGHAFEYAATSKGASYASHHRRRRF
jgi:hypothetical protein